MYHKLLFWRNQPIDVDLVFYKELKEMWENEVLFVSFGDYDASRKQYGFSDNDLNQVIIDKNSEAILDQILQRQEEYIHFFPGFRGTSSKILRKLAKKKNNIICIIAERPNDHVGSWREHLKGFASKALYRYFAKRYAKKISIFYCMGKSAMNCYIDWGFRRNTVHNFMYCCENTGHISLQDKKEKRIQPHFVYVGRMSRGYKGVDLLIKALESEPLNGIHFDFVGGHGDALDDVKHLAELKSNINYLGTWPANEVVERLRKYDVCVIPSRYDGWNLLANQAILAGVAVVITDNCGSDELVDKGKAGLVIEHGSVESLITAIEYISNHADRIEEFKEHSMCYRENIEPAIVAEYFVNVIKKEVYGEVFEVKCPWL